MLKLHLETVFFKLLGLIYTSLHYLVIVSILSQESISLCYRTPQTPLWNVPFGKGIDLVPLSIFLKNRY